MPGSVQITYLFGFTNYILNYQLKMQNILSGTCLFIQSIELYKFLSRSTSWASKAI